MVDTSKHHVKYPSSGSVEGCVFRRRVDNVSISVSSRANITFQNYFSHESKTKLALIQRQLNASVKIKETMMLNTTFENLNGLRNLNQVTNLSKNVFSSRKEKLN